MKRWTTVLACALTVGLAGAPMGVYADHHEGGHGDSDGSVSEAAAEMVEEAASMEEKAEASATDAAEKMAGEAKEAMPEGGHSEGSH